MIEVQRWIQLYMALLQTYHLKFDPYSAVRFPAKDNVNKRNFSFYFQYFFKYDFYLEGHPCAVFYVFLYTYATTMKCHFSLTKPFNNTFKNEMQWQ